VLLFNLVVLETSTRDFCAHTMKQVSDHCAGRWPAPVEDEFSDHSRAVVIILGTCMERMREHMFYMWRTAEVREDDSAGEKGALKVDFSGNDQTIDKRDVTDIDF
jgi:hypothetical protein